MEETAPKAVSESKEIEGVEGTDDKTVLQQESVDFSRKTAPSGAILSTSANHNGHPIDLTKTTSSSTPTKYDGVVLNGSVQHSEKSNNYNMTQEDERDQKLDKDTNEGATPSTLQPETTTPTTTIPPEFSQSDSSSLFLNGGLLHVTNTTGTTSTSTLLAPISVTPSRKEELLRQAQADRLAWIRHVVRPYNSSVSSRRRRQRATLNIEDDIDDDEGDHEEHHYYQHDIWTQDDRLQLLHSSHAVQHLPSVTRILSHLYGLDRTDNYQPEEDGNDAGPIVANLATRIQSILDPLGTTVEDRTVALPNVSDLHDGTTPATGQPNQQNDLEDTVFLEAYHNFWSKLNAPECTALVQSMRTFVRNLENNTVAHRNNHTSQDGVLEIVATSLRTYVDSTLESIQGHAAWKQQQATETAVEETVDSSLLRRSLESFLYGHCIHILDKVMWDAKAQEEEDEWMNRIWSLQFIQAKHLELDCLSTSNDCDDQKNGKKSFEVQILQRPMRILQSVDGYFSPFEKLQRILAVYRSVNAALSDALNRQQQAGDESSAKRLPRADDVLPTLILTVLRAKPKRILWNLRMIEAFSRPEYLRGEAGYAYTNLYGAIQFLQDINLTDEEQSSASLSIPPEEFRLGLDACRKAAEARIKVASSASSESITSQAKALVKDGQSQISARAVRQARLQGETVNLEWATRWQEDQERILSTSAVSHGAQSISSESPFGLLDLPLSAFPRSYSFLTTRPEDVRISDLPRLLNEYRTLVHTTERLLAERISESNSARKKKIAQQKNALLAKAEAVEMGPSRNPSNSNN